MKISGAFLLIFCVINLAFAYLVCRNSKRELPVIFYSLISFFASLWGLSVFLLANIELAKVYFLLALYSHYMLGFCAYLSFFWFAYLYNRPTAKSVRWPVFLTFLILIFQTILASGFMFKEISSTPSLSGGIVFSPAGYGSFTAILLFVFILGLALLARKMFSLPANNREATSLLLIANLIAGSLGIILNLLLPFYGNFSFFSINPILVAVSLTGIGLYALIRYRAFDTKIILTQVFIVGISLVFLSSLFLSKTLMQFMVNGLLFVCLVTIGSFLSRSVRKEVEQREKIEQFARKLEEANEYLREMDRQKSEFVSIASHQLRSPLTAVKGYSSMLLEGSYGPISEKMSEILRRIFESSNHLVSIVEDFLNLTRIEQGQMSYKFERVDMKELVRRVAEEYGPRAEEKNLSYSFHSGDTAEYFVKGDRDKLIQIVSNLIDNSIKYTPSGSVAVSLAKKSGGSSVLLRVEDTGVGIAPKDMKMLFRKFIRGRADGGKKLYTEGTGIGLYVAKQMIEAHQGRIWAESGGPGKGSAFFIELLSAESSLPLQNETAEKRGGSQ